jgi:hypothetical protein
MRKSSMANLSFQSCHGKSAFSPDFRHPKWPWVQSKIVRINKSPPSKRKIRQKTTKHAGSKSKQSCRLKQNVTEFTVLSVEFGHARSHLPNAITGNPLRAVETFISR